MRFLALAPALLLAAAAAGQDLTEAAAKESPRARYGALLEEFEGAYKEWSLAYRQARQSGDQEAIAKIAAERPNAEFAKRFLETGLQVAGDGAAPFFAWVVQNGYGAEQEQRQALEIILENHVQDEDMEGLASYLRYGASSVGKDEARKLLDAFVEHNPNEAVVAAALFSRATMDQRHGKMTDAEIDQACADLERLLEMEIDARTEQYAEGALFEYRNLMVGMEAPDIEGEDLDGVPFKLSDYRGKVVVLDFWGDW